MWLCNDGTYKSWLKRVKSDKASWKWLQNTASRYYTLDFRAQRFYYSHSEQQRDVSQPIPFQDILEAKLLHPHPGFGNKQSTGDVGFCVRTRERAYELYAPSDLLASQWVESLNAAKDLGAGHGLLPVKSVTSPIKSPVVRGGEVPPVLEENYEEIEDRCRETLRQMPCGIRSAAAERHPQWTEMAWSQRLAAVEKFSAEQGSNVSTEGDWDGSQSESSQLSDQLGRESSSHVRRRRPQMLSSPASSEVDRRTRAGARSSPSPMDCPGQASSLPQSEPTVSLPRDQAEAEERCRIALRNMPCSIRGRAAEECSDWGQLTWTGRFAIVRNYCLQNGFQCDDVPGLMLPPPPPTHTQSWAGRPTPQGGQQSSASPSMQGPSPHGSHQLSTLHHVKSSVEVQRLQAIFAYSDSLQVLVGHHLQRLGLAVIDAMQPRVVRSGEVVIQQGLENRNIYIVDEGNFDVLIRFDKGPQVKVCQYGPGMVFGEHAMLSNAPRPATIVATTPARLWLLERQAYEQILKAPKESKTIGLVGGVMLLINNLAGPTIVSMPALAQESGWLSIIVVQVVVAGFACACGYMLIAAMQRMPGNSNFEQRIEFANLAMFYLPHEAYVCVMFCYHSNCIMSLMSLIIQSGQVIDYLILNINGCSPGLSLSGYVCGTRTDSVTPFGDAGMVWSSSMLVVAAVCAPFAMKNLDDNVVLQYIAIAGLSVMSVIWIMTLVAEPAFPTALPAVTTSQSGLIGTVLFNFAFTSSLPSWVNEKGKDVSIGVSFAATMIYVIVIYSVIGIIGGMAYKPFYTTNENLFSKLNAGGSKMGQATVTAYPMLQNFTSIPIFSIMIRYNLIQSGVDPNLAAFMAIGLPWILSIVFYTGDGFETISEWGGLATSSVINFIVPAIIYALATGRSSKSLERSRTF